MTSIKARKLSTQQRDRFLKNPRTKRLLKPTLQNQPFKKFLLQAPFFFFIVFWFSILSAAETNEVPSTKNDLLSTNFSNYSLRLTGRSDWNHFYAILIEKNLFLKALPTGELVANLENNQNLFHLSNTSYHLEIHSATEKWTLLLTLSNNSPSNLLLKLPDASDLSEGGKRLKDISVTGFEEREKTSRTVLTSREMRYIPGGGGDVVKAVLNLPGVTPQSILSSELFIRGGSGADVLYTFDGARIDSPFHSLGFYSVFPSSSIESLNFYPSSFPVRFGGSQGAVIEVNSKDSYDKSKLMLDIEANLASVSGYLSIPFGKYIQFSLSARTTYYDFYIKLLKNILPNGTIKEVLTGFDVIPYFYDFSGKLDFNLSSADLLSLSLVASRDQVTINTERVATNSNSFTLKLESDNYWDTQIVRYEHRDTLFKNQFLLSRYFISNRSTFQNVDFERTLDSSYTVKDDALLKLGNFLELGFGSEAIFEEKPISKIDVLPTTNVTTNAGRVTTFVGRTFETNSLKPSRLLTAAYLDPQIKWGPLSLSPTLRVTFNNLNQKWDLDPRLFINLALGKQFTLSGKIGKYSQIPLLDTVATNYGDPNLSSEFAYHYQVGLLFQDQLFELKAEAYYKDLQNQVIDNPTYDFGFAPSATNQRFINAGIGRAYGAEFMFRKKLSQGLFAWFAYTLSLSERNQFQISNTTTQNFNTVDINNGLDYKTLPRKWLPYQEDVTHSLALISSFEILPKHLKLGAKATLSTGKPYTPQMVTQASSGIFTLTPSSDTYSARYPIRVTLDFRIDATFSIFKALDLSFYLDLWNLQYLWYKNVVSYSYSRNGLTKEMIGKEAPKTEIGDLPLIPLLGLSISF